MKIRLIPTRYGTVASTLACLAAPAAMAQEEPTLEITTDTLEYCITLQHMVVQRGSRLPEVQRLLNEGRRMCDHGEIRVGIARLRQAMILSRRPIEPAPEVESDAPQ
jgi:hypothetical protein